MVVSSESWACIASSAGTSGVSSAERNAALPRRTATGGLRASAATMSSTSAAKLSSGSTRLTSPTVCASPAGIRRPVSISSERHLGRDVRGEQRRDHERPQPEVDLRQAELGGGRREHDVAAERQPHPAGEAQPLHPGHDRQRAGPDRDDEPTQTAAGLVPLEPGGVVGHDRQVGAGAEDPVAGSADHHDAGVAGLRDRGDHALEHLVVQRVPALGPVERQPQHPVGPLHLQSVDALQSRRPPWRRP